MEETESGSEGKNIGRKEQHFRVIKEFWYGRTTMHCLQNHWKRLWNEEVVGLSNDGVKLNWFYAFIRRKDGDFFLNTR